MHYLYNKRPLRGKSTIYGKQCPHDVYLVDRLHSIIMERQPGTRLTAIEAPYHDRSATSVSPGKQLALALGVVR